MRSSFDSISLNMRRTCFWSGSFGCRSALRGLTFPERRPRMAVGRLSVSCLAPLGLSWPFTSEPSPNERGSNWASCSVPQRSMIVPKAFSWP